MLSVQFRVLLILVFFTAAMAQKLPESFDDWDALDDHLETGPAIGDLIPLFQAVDQTGQLLDFETIKGPNGALLLFFRSADW